MRIVHDKRRGKKIDCGVGCTDSGEETKQTIRVRFTANPTLTYPHIGKEDAPEAFPVRKQESKTTE